MARAPRTASPFEPFLTQQHPGGSLILDKNLLAIKDALGNLASSTATTGARGATGAAGAGGGFPLTSGGSASSRHDSSGAEFLSYGWAVPFSRLPARLTLVLCFYALSASGIATFRVRVGGTYRAIDGSVVGVETANSPGYKVKTITASFANPGVDGTIKLTQQSNGANDCAVDECNGTVG